MSYDPVGEIKEMFGNESLARFEWRLPNISSLHTLQGGAQHFFSPSIEILGTSWSMKLFRSDIEKTLNLSLGRRLAPNALLLTVGLRWADGIEEIFVRDQSYSRAISGLNVGTFEQRSQLPHSDTLTISITLWKDPNAVEAGRFADLETQTEEEPEVNTKDVCAMQKHLQDLLLNGDDHDVTIKVGNQEFRAHKNILRARSPVFSAMFKHQMKESTDGSISIEDSDPDAFGEFLKYVYTGKVEDLSPSNAVGLYYVADKYDFSGLKERCVQFLKTSLSTTVICDVIALATYHRESSLLECAMKFFSKHSKEILITLEWERFAKNNFTIANELYIKVLESFANKGE